MGTTGDGGATVRRRQDRLAEALRANLQRRKAQTRAKGDAEPGAQAADDMDRALPRRPQTDEGRA